MKCMQYTKVDAFAELDATELCRGHQLAGSVGTDSRRTARAGGARGADHHPRPWHIGIERRCTPEGATASPTPSGVRVAPRKCPTTTTMAPSHLADAAQLAPPFYATLPTPPRRPARLPRHHAWQPQRRVSLWTRGVQHGGVRPSGQTSYGD